MKTQIITIVIFLFLLSHLSYSQNIYRVKYQLSFQIDSTNTSKIENEIMYLDIISSGDSYFRSESIFLRDSILQSNNPHALFNVTQPNFNYSIIKKLGSDQIRSYYDFTSYKFDVSENINFKWKLKDGESKTILGYKVNSATVSFRGRNYTAWYTNEITLQNGPYKFYGLPGLILEIYDDKNHYHFTAFSIQNMPNYNSYLSLQEYKSISVNALAEFEERLKQKPSLRLDNPNIQMPKEAMDKYDRNYKERNKHKNNPIELNDNNG